MTLAARPSAGQSFLGWSGACSGSEDDVHGEADDGPVRDRELQLEGDRRRRRRRLRRSPRSASPLVRKTSTGWNVILRFRTTVSGVATVRGLRAGRTQVALSLRVAAGRVDDRPVPGQARRLLHLRDPARGPTPARARMPRHLRPQASRRPVHAHARGADRHEDGRHLVGHPARGREPDLRRPHPGLPRHEGCS